MEKLYSLVFLSVLLYLGLTIAKPSIRNKTKELVDKHKINSNGPGLHKKVLRYTTIYPVAPEENYINQSTYKPHQQNANFKSYSVDKRSTKRQALNNDLNKNIPRVDRDKKLQLDNDNNYFQKNKKITPQSRNNNQNSQAKKGAGKITKFGPIHAKSPKRTQEYHPSLRTGPVIKENTTYADADEIDDSSWVVENKEFVDTRRILYSKPAKHPHMSYMVYLQLARNSKKAQKYIGWLCGGVIVHRYYVLTSAACVEDADHFFVVSGTSKWVESENIKLDKCVCKNRRKVIWKCTPKSYRFDFRDSEKWAANDIAIVRVDRAFNLNVKERYCEYATEAIPYNNISRSLEVAGVKGFIMGWGSLGNFREGVYRRKREVITFPQNSNILQMAKVLIMDNELCTKKWAPKFREIIRRYMICTRDILKRLSGACDKNHAKCKEIEDDYRKSGRYNETLFEYNGLQLKENKIVDVDNDLVKDIELEDEINNKQVKLDLGRHLRDPNDISARRSSWSGGFCENDHGGPLVVNYQGTTVTIGVISACKIDPKKHMCHGPFLYTSIFNNRQFISCSIYKDVEETCRRVFRTGITHDEWAVDWNGIDDDYESSPGQEGEAEEDRGEENIYKKALEDRPETPTSEKIKQGPLDTEVTTKSNSSKVEMLTVATGTTNTKPEEPTSTVKTTLPKESKAVNTTSSGSEVKTEEPAVSHIQNVFQSYESSNEMVVNEPTDL